MLADEKGSARHFSILIPGAAELHSATAHDIMESLEISDETRPEILREWAQRIKNDPNLLINIYRDYMR